MPVIQGIRGLLQRSRSAPTEPSVPSRPVQTFPNRSAAREALLDARLEPTDIQRHPSIQKFKDGSVRIDYVAAQLNRTETRIPFSNRVINTGKLYVSSDGKDAYTDGHFHPTNYVQRGFLPKELLAMMDKLNIRNCVLMPIPTSLQATEGGGTLIQPDLLRTEVINNKGLCTVVTPTKKSATGNDAPAGRAGGRQREAQGRCRAHHHCEPLPTYYVPEHVEVAAVGKDNKLNIDDFIRDPWLIDEIVRQSVLYIDTGVNSTLAAHMKLEGLHDAELSRFDPMLTGFNLGDARAGEKLLATLCLNQGTFTGIGEITVHKELVEDMYADQRGQATTQKPGGLAGLMNLMEMAGVVGAPVVLHCDIDSLKRQVDGNHIPGREPSNFASLRNLFTDPRLKDTTIVWAHGGGLGRFVQGDAGHLERLGALLQDCPNLHLDISWAAVARQVLRSPESREAWTKFLGANSERICFGSDALAPTSLAAWEETKVAYEAILEKLPPPAKNNLLNSTYERVFVDARQKMRDFESKVLTPEFYKKYVLSSTGDQQPVSAATVRRLKQVAMPDPVISPQLAATVAT
jgi:Amidohydrolase